jgi:hypothetical protein
MLLIIIDAYSKWIDVHVTNGSTSQLTIEKLSVIMGNHGLPGAVFTKLLKQKISAQTHRNLKV